MISRTAEYALRAVVFLAEQASIPRTTRQISGATLVPHDYLSKTLQVLVRAGLVMARRGLHGGFVLARPPQCVRVLDVINAIDPLKRNKNCPLNRAEHGRLCPLHKRLDEAAALVEDTFRSTTIADLMRGTTKRPAADGQCSFPGVPAAGDAGLFTLENVSSSEAAWQCASVARATRGRQTGRQKTC